MRLTATPAPQASLPKPGRARASIPRRGGSARSLAAASRGERIRRFGAEALGQADRPFESLLRRVRPDLSRVLAEFRIPQQDAEDLLQETLVALVFKWQSIRKPEAWLLSTLRNRCLTYWRQKRDVVYETVDSSILEILAGPQSPPQERAELRHDLNVAIAKLPPICRDLLRLRYGLGCESSEVAERLGYESTGVRKLTTSCLAFLSRELRQAGLGREDFLD
jgi:RNA polymerase sigma factor (sigma-70 family)